MPLERCELGIRRRVQLVEPVPQRRDRLRPQPEDPRPRIVGWTLVGDDSRAQQDTEVPAHRRAGRAGPSGELARTTRTRAQELNHTLAGGIRKRRKERSQLVADDPQYLSKLATISRGDTFSESLGRLGPLNRCRRLARDQMW